MGVPKEWIGGGLVAAGLLQAILNPITTFATTWTSCHVTFVKLEWGLQSACFAGLEMEYDTHFTNTMAAVSDNFSALMTGCSIIEIGNVLAMCLGIVAAMAGGLGAFASMDREAAETSFKVARVLLATDAFLRVLGVGLWMVWIMPTIGDIDMMEPLKTLGGDAIPSIPFVTDLKCSNSGPEFGLIGTAFEIIVMFNAVIVVGILNENVSARSAREVPGRGSAAVQMMNIRGSQAPMGPGAYPPGPPGYGMQPPAYGMQPPAYGQQPPAYGQQPPPYGMPPGPPHPPAFSGMPAPPRPSGC